MATTGPVHIKLLVFTWSALKPAAWFDYRIPLWWSHWAAVHHQTICLLSWQQDEDVDRCFSALLTLTNKLTETPGDTQRLLQVSASNLCCLHRSIIIIFILSVFLLQEVFDQSFDTALHSLISDFLSRIEQMFPIPSFRQVLSLRAPLSHLFLPVTCWLWDCSDLLSKIHFKWFYWRWSAQTPLALTPQRYTHTFVVCKNFLVVSERTLFLTSDHQKKCPFFWHT